jgi:hypothetical protein
MAYGLILKMEAICFSVSSDSSHLYSVTTQKTVCLILNIFWSTDPLLGRYLEAGNEYSSFNAIA